MKKNLTFTAIFIFITLIVSLEVINIMITKATPTQQTPIPPDLTITYDNMQVDISKLPMGWVKYPKSTKVDYPTPETLAKKINASIVKPETALNLNFSEQPASITVILWDKGSKEYKCENNRIIAPKESGTYIFAVTGEWLKGQVMYVFKLNVK